MKNTSFESDKIIEKHDRVLFVFSEIRVEMQCPDLPALTLHNYNRYSTIVTVTLLIYTPFRASPVVYLQVCKLYC